MAISPTKSKQQIFVILTMFRFSSGGSVVALHEKISFSMLLTFPIPLFKVICCRLLNECILPYILLLNISKLSTWFQLNIDISVEYWLILCSIWYLLTVQLYIWKAVLLIFCYWKYYLIYIVFLLLAIWSYPQSEFEVSNEKGLTSHFLRCLEDLSDLYPVKDDNKRTVHDLHL